MPPPADQRETILILADLIESQMALPAGVVSVYNQKRRIPPTDGIFVDIAVLSMQPYAANSKPEVNPQSADLNEVQTICQREDYQIDIFSAGTTARQRRTEVLFALTGVAAQQAQERYAFQIARVPHSWVDVSELEAAARLNRYALTVTVLRAYSQVRTIPTFTVFQNPPQTLLVNP